MSMNESAERAARDGSTKVQGVGPDAPTSTNEAGGKQSVSAYRCDLLPAVAVLEVAAIFKEGAQKYGEHNWEKIPVEDHLNHLLVHVYAWLAGDRSDNHLGHAACRALMALELAGGVATCM